MAAAARQRPGSGPGGWGGAAIDESLVCGLNLPIYFYVVVYETDKYIYMFVGVVSVHSCFRYHNDAASHHEAVVVLRFESAVA